MLTTSKLSKPSFRWKQFWHYYLFFLFFSAVFQVYIYINLAGSTGLRQAVYMSFLWMIPVLLLPNFSRWTALAIGIVLWMASLVNWGYLAIYGQEFSQSVLFIIFESNWAESSEFIESYYQWWMLPALIAYTMLSFYLWQSLKPIAINSSYQLRIIPIIVLILSWPFSNQFFIKQQSFDKAIDKQLVRMIPVVPWNLVFGYVNYQRILSDIERQLLANQQIKPFENLSEQQPEQAKTLVLVIGESTNRQRMSLYGYHRNTNPELSQLKNELVVFDNVYAPRPYTIETLEQVLSFSDELHPNLYLHQPNLINLMQQAGYKTYWITNQQTQTRRNTMLTVFSKQADEQTYLNNNRMQNTYQFDELVFAPFKKYLNDKAKKKFIVVHLLGTHRKYYYRYPESYDVFKDNTDIDKRLSDEQVEEYNQYDNAVRYNDHIVAELINCLKQSNDNGFLSYFSDHGEEVYDHVEHLFAGRNEATPTSAMYTIPFIVWQSPHWHQQHPITQNSHILSRPYSTSDFIYTWADLAGINFTGFKPERSIINASYQPHPILIGDPLQPNKLRDLLKQPFNNKHQHLNQRTATYKIQTLPAEATSANN